MMKNIVLCADDFGLHDDVNAAIIFLLKNNRISATSCMTNMAYFSKETIKALKEIRPEKDVGLHFNLTEGSPLTSGKTLVDQYGHFLPLYQVIFKAHLHRLHYQDVYHELNAQYQRFIESMDGLPSHIDGHQHIHHLPVVRQVLIDFFNKKGLHHKLYVRNVAPCYPLTIKQGWIKQKVILYTGAKRFNQMLISNNIQSNQSFGGIYAFGEIIDYRQQFLSFIAQIHNKGLIMCHPSLSASFKDPIAQHRKIEFDYLSSEMFLEDQLKYQFKVTKFL